MVPAKYAAEWREILPILRWNSAPFGAGTNTGVISCVAGTLIAVAIKVLGRRIQIHDPPAAVGEFHLCCAAEERHLLPHQRKARHKPCLLQFRNRVRSATENPWTLPQLHHSVGNQGRTPRRVPPTTQRTRRPAIENQNRTRRRLLQRLAQLRRFEPLERRHAPKVHC